MEKIESGSVLTPGGFRAGAARCGLKTASDAPDVALVLSEGPAAAAGCFTTNAFAAAPVRWCRARLPSERTRAIVANAGNANACTGKRGMDDVRATAGLVAELAGCRPEEVCVASTGIIGRFLPMDRLLSGVRKAWVRLSSEPEAARAAERAIMTTDTRPKAAAFRGEIGGAPFSVGAMAKGAGMIAPHMATTLAFLTTDAAVPPGILAECLSAAIERTFNRITIDGDASTNDAAIVLAGGASGAAVGPDGTGREAFAEALEGVLDELARQIVSDGEGATRTMVVRVRGAADEADARRIARAIAESQLVKCALYGGDPNWGRIVCAVGYSGARVEPERLCLSIGGAPVFRDGTPTGRDAGAEMRAAEVSVLVELGLGEGAAQMRTCDLSAEYVRINSAYHT